MAWKKGRGYGFSKVSIGGAFVRSLRSIADAAEANLTERGEPLPYSIGDEIESDECMAFSYVQVPVTPDDLPAMTAQSGRSRRRVAGALTDDPVAFRDRLVQTVGPQDEVGREELGRAVDSGLIAFYAIVRGYTRADRVAYVRHLNPVRFNKPGNILATFGDTLTALSEPVFAIDQRIDLIIRPHDIVIFDKTFFESLFFDVSGEGTELDDLVNETLSCLPFVAETQRLLVSKSRNKRRMRRKLLELRHSNHLENVTIGKFELALQGEGFERSRFINDDGEIYASEEDVDLLLLILNEDLFEGKLSGRRLAAGRKRER